jgi:transposase
MARGQQIIKEREYVYEYRSIWNKEKRRSEQKREYIGRIIDGKFVPNSKYLLRKELKKRKIPVVELNSTPTTGCKRIFAGATYLFDKIGEVTGVAEDIKASFPGIYQELLSLSYFIALEPFSPLYRFKRWAVTHEHPYGREISSQRSSELLSTITEDAKMDFLKRQSKRRAETEYLFCDSTSISSYSEQLKQVKFGKNKDGDSLPQLNLALLLEQASGLPVYYRKLPGNITDVMTIKNLLTSIEYLNLKRVCLVMDRGFYSEKNVNAMLKGQHKFVLGTKISLSFIQNILKSERVNFDNRANYNSETGLFMKTHTLEWNYKETMPVSGKILKEKHPIYVHMYYNDQRATDEKIHFHKMLDRLEEEILTGKRKACKEKQYRKYYDITETPEYGVKIVPKQSAMDKAREDFGFFVFLSNDIKDPVDAVRAYRSKDMIEKAFSDLKDRLSMRRTSVSSEENLEGKLFIQFVGLIYLSYVKQAMDKSGLFKHYTMQELFDEVDVIEKYKQTDGFYYGEITDKQKKIYAALGFEMPT